MYGIGNQAVDKPAEIFWGGSDDHIQILRSANEIIDSGVTIGSPVSGQPATKWPAGLLVGKVTATGKIRPWDNAASDGTETVYGVLDRDYSAVDEFNNAVDVPCAVVVSAPVKVEKLLVDGGAFVGDTAEAAGRTELNAKRFYLDDEYC